MIQNIRDWSKSWISWAIIVTICITFALWGVHSYFATKVQGGTLVKVNGEPISQRQLGNAYNGLRRALMVQYKNQLNLTPELEEKLKKQALEQLINTEVLVQAAQKEEYVVSPAHLAQTVRELPLFQKDGRFSLELFDKFMRLGLYNEQTFARAVERNELINQVKASYLITGFASKDSLKMASDLLNQARDVQYLTIPLSYFKVDTKAVSDTAIKEYYAVHKAEFMIPEKVSVDYIELSIDNIMKTISADETTVKAYYQTNIDKYTTPAQWRLKTLNIDSEDLFKINQNQEKSKTIEELAAFYPDAKVETKWVPKQQLSASLVASLKNTSEMSKPVAKENGYIVYELVAKRDKQTSAFSVIKDKVANDYKRQQARSIYDGDLDQLTNITFEQPDSLKPAATALGLDIQSTDAFSRRGEEKGVASNPSVVSAAFSDDVLRDKNNSSVIHISNDSSVVIRVKTHQTAREEAIDKIKEKITAALIKTKQQKHALLLAEKMKDALAKGESFEKIAKAHELPLNSVGYVRRNNDKLESNVLQSAFSIHYSANTLKNNTELLPLESGDYDVILVKGVRVDAPTEATNQAEMIKDQVTVEAGELEYALYAKEAMDNAKIEYE